MGRQTRIQYRVCAATLGLHVDSNERSCHFRFPFLAFAERLGDEPRVIFAAVSIALFGVLRLWDERRAQVRKLLMSALIVRHRPALLELL